MVVLRPDADCVTRPNKCACIQGFTVDQYHSPRKLAQQHVSIARPLQFRNGLMRSPPPQKNAIRATKAYAIAGCSAKREPPRMLVPRESRFNGQLPCSKFAIQLIASCAQLYTPAAPISTHSPQSSSPFLRIWLPFRMMVKVSGDILLSSTPSASDLSR